MVALSYHRVLLDKILKNGVDSRVDMDNVLIDMYAQSRCMADAHKVLKTFMCTMLSLGLP